MNVNITKQKKRLETTIKNAGPRYTAGLNVEVSIAKVFDGFGRTFAYYDELKSKVAEFSSATKSHEIEKVKVLLGEPYFLGLTKECEELITITAKIPDSGAKVQLPLQQIVSQGKKTIKKLERGFNILRKKKEEERKKNPKPERDTLGYDYDEPFRTESNYLNNLYSKTRNLIYFCRGQQSKAANHKFIILRGEAGSGKTHFLCDLTKSRLKAGLPTLIFLGQEFNNKDPWITILKSVGWTGTKKEFLDHLEKSASSKRTRFIIVIDAVNEQRKKVNWASLVEDTKNYKSIGVILSVRIGFESIVLPKKLRKKALDVIHEGFADREWDALTGFFEFYNLEPDLPLLFPDFSNPLFLKIFCETYQENGNTIRLRGHFGFTRVFERYVVKQGERVLRDMSSSNMDAQNLVWRKTIKKIADYMVQNRTERIPLAEIEAIATQVFPTNAKDYLNALERNWLILKNPVYSDQSPYGLTGYEYTFPYQKFSDHLIIRHLLSDSASIKDPKTLFVSGGRLEYLFQNTWQFRGLIDALAVQIPERFDGKELILLAGKKFERSILAKDSFLHSLVWRDTQEKGSGLKFFNHKRILRIINKIIMPYHREGNDDVLETILTVAAIPKHPLNAQLLSSHLGKFTLAKKDSIWLPFLMHKHNNSSAVDRMIHWALRISDRTSYSDESIRLISIALAWFLSSSDRYIRDKTTKALVSLLRDRLGVLLKVLKHFEKCNDPYIQERLLAVAYGCALQSESKELGDLGLYIYKRIFAAGKPPVHLLIRDYARGIVEVALRVFPDLKTKINVGKIVPPYGSAWPKNIPTLDHLKRKYDSRVYGPRNSSAYGQIWHSLMYNNQGGIADFGNYVVNSALSHWSDKRLKKDGSAPLSKLQVWEAFLDGLDPSKRKLWEKYEESKQRTYIFRPVIIKFEPSMEIIRNKVEEKKLAKALLNMEKAKEKFEVSLTPIEQIAYKKASRYFAPRKSGPIRRGGRLNEPSGAEIQRLIFKKVIQLGWTPELFYDFDSNVRERDRSANKIERIGKKYQWIAFHEMLARLADNYAFKAGWSERYSVYEGPWELYARDIDPSHDLALVDRNFESPRWWSPKRYGAWQKSLSHSKWIRDFDATQLTDKFISLKDPNGDEWISLEGYNKWREPQKPGRENSYSSQEREVWILQKGFIVRNRDAEKLYTWAKGKNYIGGWLPDTEEFHRIYLREFPDATAYISDHWNGWNGKTRWRKMRDEKRSDTNIEVFAGTEKYMNEATTHDCSVKDTVHVYMPAKEIVDSMKIKRSIKNPGEFVDKTGKVIAQDPSVNYGGENALLVRKQDFLEFLKKKKYSVVWAVMGEKLVLGMSGEYGRLEFGGTYLMDKNGKVKGKKYKDLQNFQKPKKRT